MGTPAYAKVSWSRITRWCQYEEGKITFQDAFKSSSDSLCIHKIDYQKAFVNIEKTTFYFERGIRLLFFCMYSWVGFLLMGLAKQLLLLF